MFRRTCIVSCRFALTALALLVIGSQSQAQEAWGGRYSGNSGVGYAPRDYYTSRVNPTLNTAYYPRDYYQSSSRWKSTPDTITVPYYSGYVTYSTVPTYGYSYSTFVTPNSQGFSPPVFEQNYYNTYGTNTYGTPNYSQNYYSTFGNENTSNSPSAPRYSYSLPPATSGHSYRMPSR
jgi:hypothetical protein